MRTSCSNGLAMNRNLTVNIRDVASWPRTVPGFIPALVPRTVCRAVQKMALLVRPPIASVGCSILGSAVSPYSMSPMPLQMRARITRLLTLALAGCAPVCARDAMSFPGGRAAVACGAIRVR